MEPGSGKRKHRPWMQDRINAAGVLPNVRRTGCSIRIFSDASSGPHNETMAGPVRIFYAPFRLQTQSVRRHVVGNCERWRSARRLRHTPTYIEEISDNTFANNSQVVNSPMLYVRMYYGATSEDRHNKSSVMTLGFRSIKAENMLASQRSS
jgi:hypothetical protein